MKFNGCPTQNCLHRIDINLQQNLMDIQHRIASIALISFTKKFNEYSTQNCLHGIDIKRREKIALISKKGKKN